MNTEKSLLNSATYLHNRNKSVENNPENKQDLFEKGL